VGVTGKTEIKEDGLRKIHRLLAVLTVALAALALTSNAAFAQSASASASAGASDALVRVAHLASDAPNVDVYVDGEPVAELTDVPYGTVSGYLPLPAGTHQVTVYATGDTSTPVIDTTVEVAGGLPYTIAAIGLVEDGSLTAQVYEDDLRAPAAGDAKLRVVHASPDAGPVDVVPRGGDPLVEALTYPDASPYAEVPAGTYTLDVNAAGTNQAAITVPDATVEADTVYTAFAVGTAAAGDLEVILTTDSVNGMSVMPDTGGIPPALIPVGALSVLVVGAALLSFFALRWRSA
jgi:hypothetical protein